MTFAFYSLLIFFVVLCVLFAGLILIQKGRGGGISSAFGGAGGNTAFGSKTGDVLTWATSIVFGIFLVCCVSLSLLANEVNSKAVGSGVVAPAPPKGAGGIPMAVPTTDPAVPEAHQPTTTPAATSQPAIVPNPIPLGTPAP